MTLTPGLTAKVRESRVALAAVSATSLAAPRASVTTTKPVSELLSARPRTRDVRRLLTFGLVVRASVGMPETMAGGGVVGIGAGVAPPPPPPPLGGGVGLRVAVAVSPAGTPSSASLTLVSPTTYSVPALNGRSVWGPVTSTRLPGAPDRARPARTLAPAATSRWRLASHGVPPLHALDVS